MYLVCVFDCAFTCVFSSHVCPFICGGSKVCTTIDCVSGVPDLYTYYFGQSTWHKNQSDVTSNYTAGSMESGSEMKVGTQLSRILHLFFRVLRDGIPGEDTVS